MSAVIICRDEERYIEKCLNSLINIFNDIVVIDTGSKDRTRDILSKFQENIDLYSCEWNCDFSEIRNYGMALARHDWVIFIDADEVLLKNAGLELIIRNGVDILNAYCSDVLRITILDSPSNLLSTIPRIIKRSSGAYYYGSVHELILAEDGTEKHAPVIPITFKHYGYQPYTQWVKGKFYRNISLLRRMLVQDRSVYRWKYFYVRNNISNGLLSQRIFNESISLIDYVFSHSPESWGDGINLILKMMEVSKVKGNANVIVFLYKRYRHLTVCNASFLFFINEMINISESNKYFICNNISKVVLENDFNFEKSKNAHVITSSGLCYYVSDLKGVAGVL
ncbi:glycosyltransferase family 2 protein [Aeromonas media]|uniref:glycosyltransferase family 2 protein n=1 Tax=Aeromonas media TaxID=651 RepID=UPI001BCF1E88|nr:glycosyltransferase family 2 protein [Aeromonas media]